MDTSRLIFVDCEARGPSPVRGVMTEFGAIHYDTRQSFHGVLFHGSPDPDNPAVPLVAERVATDSEVAAAFASWLSSLAVGHPVFVSDNPAFDWQWIAALFAVAEVDNPFGHSARRISDFYAGLTRNWPNTQQWKRWRITTHDHNPVHDALGNAEAFERMLREYGIH
jgi:hypothetical protein